MYNPPTRGLEYIFYVSLIDQANTKLFKASPTLAAGDVKVSTDGAAEANITTLPTVTPAAGKHVKVTLSATEMNGSNISIVFSDAAGDEWCDLQVDIQPNAAIAGGVCTTGGNTTLVVSSSFSIAPGGVPDTLNGRILIFDANTTTAALRGSGSTIDACSTDSPPRFTLHDALKASPASGDTYKVY